MTATRRAKALARRVPGAVRVRREMWERRSVALVLRSRLFDDGWYAAQTGRTDLTGESAVTHYVRQGRRAGLSPAPFFEPSAFDPAWRKRVEDPFAVFLRDGEARRQRRWHSAVTFALDDLQLRPGGGLLPPDPGTGVLVDLDGEMAMSTLVPWRVVSDLLLARTLAWRAQEDARLGSRRSPRPPEDESAFRAGMAEIAMPSGDGGRPLVSVVMPTWNRQASVGRAVRSVQAQTLTDWELVVADDGSADDTLAVLEGIAHFDDRVVTLPLERSGVSAARNAAIARARGRYVAFLDSDNTWEPQFLELMVKGMQDRASTAAFSSIELVAGDRRDFRVGGGDREQLLVGNHVDLNALVVRADRLARTGGFAVDLRRTVDYDLVLKLSETSALDFLPFVGVVYDDDEGAQGADRISVREPLTWDYVTRYRHSVDWSPAAPRRPDLTTVVMTTSAPRASTAAAVQAVLAQEDLRGDLEVVLVARGGTRADALSLALLQLVDSRVRVVRTTVDVGVPLALDVGASRARGAMTVLMTPGTRLDAGCLRGMQEVLEGEDAPAAVQPLVVGTDDLVAGAGAVLTRGGNVVPFLQGHAASELDAAGPLLPVPALFGGPVAGRTDDVVAVGGLDPLLAGDLAFSDLSLRLARHRRRQPAVLTTSTARSGGKSWNGPLARTDAGVCRDRYRDRPADVRPYAGVGLELSAVQTHFRREGGPVLRPVLHRRRTTVRDGAAAGMPSLRWSLITAAPGGPKGRAWGDKHFAEALARALRRLGQDAHAYAREARERQDGYLDDVRLSIRGLDAVVTDPGRMNITWVISHPDAVTDAELRAPDLVFAAGAPWAREASRRSGRTVGLLPQCTDPHLFHPVPGVRSTGRPGHLFVGNSRNILRPSVAHLVAADVPVAVYGDGWQDLVPEGTVRATYLPNEDLGRAYWDAGVVLNDHWADMRDEGFVSNRLFDAAAAGGCVLSDAVEGIEDLLPGSVRTWSSAQELVALATTDRETLFGAEDERRERAARVAREHSFDARALRLLTEAARLDGSRGQRS